MRPDCPGDLGNGAINWAKDETFNIRRAMQEYKCRISPHNGVELLLLVPGVEEFAGEGESRSTVHG